MSWIKRCVSAALARLSAAKVHDVPQNAGTRAAGRPMPRPVLVSEATKAMLRDGFRSSASAGDRSVRTLTAIAATHAPPPPFVAQQGRAGALPIPASGTAGSVSAMPASGPRVRRTAGVGPQNESGVSGAQWTGAPAPVQGFIAGVDPGASVATPWLISPTAAEGPGAFGELTAAGVIDLSPSATCSSQVSSYVDVLGTSPDARFDVLGREGQ